jgi:hypothetical protein
MPSRRSAPMLPSNHKSLPLLRPPHDHHRALRTRRNATLLGEPANASDQDRHLVIPLPLMNDSSRTTFAGLQPAAAKLAFIRSICRQLHSQSPRAACSAFTSTNRLIVPTPQKYLATRPSLTSSAPPACSNLHSLFAVAPSCGANGPLPPDAISCLGAFRTPAGREHG